MDLTIADPELQIKAMGKFGKMKEDAGPFAALVRSGFGRLG